MTEKRKKTFAEVLQQEGRNSAKLSQAIADEALELVAIMVEREKLSLCLVNKNAC